MRGLLSTSVTLSKAKLPHPPIMEGLLIIIENALQEAWLQVCQAIVLDGIDISTAYEDQLTVLIWEYLNTIRLQKPSLIYGFDEDQFESVQRESNWQNCQNSSIDKQPDLVFKFRGRRDGVSVSSTHYDGLFVECKPIDQKHSLKKHYLEKGLVRFIDGTYAWAMQDAMMLAYVHNNSSLSDHLIPLLEDPKLQLNSKPILGQGESITLNKCVSEHNRDYVYPSSGEKASPIRVRHLWLKAESKATEI